MGSGRGARWPRRRTVPQQGSAGAAQARQQHGQSTQAAAKGAGRRQGCPFAARTCGGVTRRRCKCGGDAPSCGRLPVSAAGGRTQACAALLIAVCCQRVERVEAWRKRTSRARERPFSLRCHWASRLAACRGWPHSLSGLQACCPASRRIGSGSHRRCCCPSPTGSAATAPCAAHRPAQAAMRALGLLRAARQAASGLEALGSSQELLAACAPAAAPVAQLTSLRAFQAQQTAGYAARHRGDEEEEEEELAAAAHSSRPHRHSKLSHSERRQLFERRLQAAEAEAAETEEAVAALEAAEGELMEGLRTRTPVTHARRQHIRRLLGTLGRDGEADTAASFVSRCGSVLGLRPAILLPMLPWPLAHRRRPRPSCEQLLRRAAAGRLCAPGSRGGRGPAREAAGGWARRARPRLAGVQRRGRAVCAAHRAHRRRQQQRRGGERRV